MRIDKNDTEWLYWFDNINDLVYYIVHTDIIPGTYNFSKTEEPIFVKKVGTKTYKESIELLYNGCPDIASKINNKSINYNNYKKCIKYSCSGYVPSIERYLRGCPDNMIVYEKKKSRRIINVYKSVSFPFNVNADAIIYSSKICMDIIKNLEYNGFMCNLYTFFCTEYKNSNKTKRPTKTTIVTKIKNYSDKFDCLRLSYPLCHPSFLRRQMIAVLERDENLLNAKNKENFKSLGSVKDKKIFFVDGIFLPSIPKEEWIEINDIKRLRKIEDSTSVI